MKENDFLMNLCLLLDMSPEEVFGDEEDNLSRFFIVNEEKDTIIFDKLQIPYNQNKFSVCL